MAMYKYICLDGTPYERGCEYGRQAKEEVGESLALYRELFAAYANMQWSTAVTKAKRFLPFIESYLPDSIDEMRGIAEGAGVAHEDILALNCRSELMFALPDGCTSAIIPPAASADGQPYLAQTWDWLAPARKSVVVVEIRQPPLPTIIMACEAGLIGGKGVNSAGIGCGLNALGVGRGKLGTPLHIMYRGIMNAVKISDAIEAVSRPERAGSGNFFMGSSEGIVLNLEFTPENFDVMMADDLPLAHANHYLSPLLAGEDKLKANFACSFPRYHRAGQLLRAKSGALTREDVCEILADHVGYPDSICNHEDPRDAEWSRYCTVYGVFIDLVQHVLWVAPGNPCERHWQPYRLRQGE